MVNIEIWHFIPYRDLSSDSTQFRYGQSLTVSGISHHHNDLKFTYLKEDFSYSIADKLRELGLELHEVGSAEYGKIMFRNQ